MPIDSPFLFKQIIETCHTADNLSKAIGDYNDKDSLWLYDNDETAFGCTRTLTITRLSSRAAGYRKYKTSVAE